LPHHLSREAAVSRRGRTTRCRRGRSRPRTERPADLVLFLRSAAYNRGAYLVTTLAHCGERHTPRNFLGALRSSQWLAGTPDGPDGQLVPNITPDPDTGIGKWEKEDVVELLKTGTTPEQGKVKGAMRETIQDGLKYLTDTDLDAIADYLFAQPPIVHEVSPRR
jgi:mono/diheme cytochrome c family protein